MDENMEVKQSEEQEMEEEIKGESETENEINVETESDIKGEKEGKEGKKGKKNKGTQDKYIKLRKILSTAALSAALISWYTTANGLHQYVFDNLWQAYVISAALQGALFALSIKGIEIFLDFKAGKKLLLGITWACLLVASSIFSYVYISRDVYSDKLLCEDAHRIFSTYCLTKNYALDAAADELLHGSEDSNDGGIVDSMVVYAGQLAVLGNGVDLSEGGNDKKLETLKASLIKYRNVNGSGGTNEYVDTSFLITYIEHLLTGKYTSQDIADTRNEIQHLDNSINEKIEEKKNEKAEKIQNKDQYQSRLKDYTNTEIQAFKDLTGDLKDELNNIDEINSLIGELQTEQRDIQQVSNILDLIENSMGSALYNQVLQLRSALNAEKVQVGDVRQIAEEIYNVLLNNNIVDSRFEGYPGFLNNVTRYDAVTKAQASIEMEIEALYNLKSVYELIYESSENVPEDCVSESRINDNKVFYMETWRSYWQEHLNSLKRNVKMLRTGGLDEALISDLIAEMEKKERLYLSDLNDFERAWGLLWGEHPYKTLLKFSFGFSFGIDLFSVFMSIMLYILKEKAKKARQKVNV